MLFEVQQDGLLRLGELVFRFDCRDPLKSLIPRAWRRCKDPGRENLQDHVISISGRKAIRNLKCHCEFAFAQKADSKVTRCLIVLGGNHPTSTSSR
jgi:hypothetical protein